MVRGSFRRPFRNRFNTVQGWLERACRHPVPTMQRIITRNSKLEQFHRLVGSYQGDAKLDLDSRARKPPPA